MSNELLGIIVGGIIPAFFFAFSSLFAKSSMNASIGIGIYLMVISASVFVAGCVGYLLIPDRTVNTRSALHAFLGGGTWAVGAGLLAIALSRYSAPISKLVPLYNMNTLIAVLLGLVLFSESQQVNMLRLAIGSVLITIGGILVSNA